MGLDVVRELLQDGEDDWVMVDDLIALAWQEAAVTGEDPKAVAAELLRDVLVGRA